MHSAHTSKVEALTREHEEDKRRLQAQIEENRKLLHNQEQELQKKELE